MMDGKLNFIVPIKIGKIVEHKKTSF